MKTNRHTPTFKAFTLIELLVVISIIAVLAAILLSVIGKTMDMATKVTDTNSLRQIGIAAAQYMGEHNGSVPTINSNSTDKPNYTTLSWMAVIDSYIGSIPGVTNQGSPGNPSSASDFQVRGAPYISRDAKAYPGWTPYKASGGGVQKSPVAFGYNAYIDDKYWAGAMTNLDNGKWADGSGVQRSQIFIVGEFNDEASAMQDTSPATTAKDVACRYRVSHPNKIGLYLFADLHVEGLVGSRDSTYYTTHPTEKNIWKWW